MPQLGQIAQVEMRCVNDAKYRVGWGAKRSVVVKHRISKGKVEVK